MGFRVKARVMEEDDIRRAVRRIALRAVPGPRDGGTRGHLGISWPHSVSVRGGAGL